MNNLDILVNQLREYDTETSWFEFKHNNYDPEMIGQDISALANSAAYYEKSYAYMVWGVHDKTHEIVGTKYNQHTLKVGNEEIESWLRKLLSKNAEFEFHAIKMPDSARNIQDIVVLIIAKAANQTVTFKKADYIRVGSYTKQLNDYPAMKAQLWDRLRSEKFEDIIAKSDLLAQEALNLIDFAKYFELMNENIPSNEQNILHYMTEENLIKKLDNGRYGITNLGAILFAKNISAFPSVSRKAVRVVQYKGNDKLDILKEFHGGKGYAVGFEGLTGFLDALLPSQEIFENGLRKSVSAYPDVAIREAIANALIHQDFSISGTGPVIEVFDSRIEITNPGIPLVDIKRIIDNPPKSRNERLADLMRRLRMCEELGSGWDRMTISCEIRQIPAPKITLYDESTKITLYKELPFSDIPIEDKIWACYLHACVKNVSGGFITNKSVRDRFGLPEKSSANASRLIKDTVQAGLIKPFDPDTAPRYMKYMPFWA